MRTVLFFLLLFIFSIVVNTSVLNSFASQSKSTHLLEHHPEITTEFESALEHKKLHQLPSHDQSCEDACHCNCNQCFSPLIAFHSLALENINSQIIC